MLETDRGQVVALCDPRRFGSMHLFAGRDDEQPLLAALGPEPLTAAFNADYLYAATRRRTGPIKQALMDNHLVVGVGNIYAAEAGGLHESLAIARLCHLAGVGVCIGAMPELGPGTAAHGHLAAAVPTIDHPCDVTGALYHADDLVLEAPPIDDGDYLVTDAPGLGVTLDDDAVARHRI